MANKLSSSEHRVRTVARRFKQAEAGVRAWLLELQAQGLTIKQGNEVLIAESNEVWERMCQARSEGREWREDKASAKARKNKLAASSWLSGHEDMPVDEALARLSTSGLPY